MGLGTRESPEQEVVAIGKVRDEVFRVWAGLEMGKKKREELTREPAGNPEVGQLAFQTRNVIYILKVPSRTGWTMPLTDELGSSSSALHTFNYCTISPVSVFSGL